MQMPDVDVFFFGPADLSASVGFAAQWEGRGATEILLRTQEKVRAQGFQCGVVAGDPASARKRTEQGFKLIGLRFDCGLLVRTIAEMKEVLMRPGWSAKCTKEV